MLVKAANANDIKQFIKIDNVYQTEACPMDESNVDELREQERTEW